MLLEARTGSDPIRGSSSGCVRSTLYSLRAPPPRSLLALRRARSFFTHHSFRGRPSENFFICNFWFCEHILCARFSLNLLVLRVILEALVLQSPCVKKAPLKCFYTKELQNNATIYRSYIKQIYIYLLRLHFLTYFF